MIENPYSIVRDGSNDSGLSKMNPVYIYIFDIEWSKQVEFKFYLTCLTSGEHCPKSGDSFTMNSDNLDWVNIVFVGLDNKM